MDDLEQIGTANKSIDAPEGTGESLESQTVQPVGEDTAEPEKPDTTTTNWEDPANPFLKFRDQYTGLQGNFKQLKSQFDEMRGQLETERAQRLRIQQEAEEQRLQQLLESDPEELQRELRTRYESQRAQRDWQQQHVPQVQRQAYQQILSQYHQAVQQTATDLGLDEEEVKAIGKEHPGDFTGFMKGLVGKAVEKQMGPVDKLVDERVGAAIKAAESRLLANQRGSQRSPDTGTAPPSQNYANLSELRAAFLDGAMGDPYDAPAQSKFRSTAKSLFGYEP